MSHSLTDPSADIQATSVQAPIAVRTLGDIAATLPGAIAIFRHYKLDYFCSGDVTLAEAATAGGIVLADLVTGLNALNGEPRTTPDAISTGADRPYRSPFSCPPPSRTARTRSFGRTDRSQVSASSVRAGLADMLEIIGQELITHMEQEEQSLFPAMRAGDGSVMRQSIAVMRADHHGHGEQISRLEALADDFSLPEDSCADWRKLYVGGRKLADDLMEHIHTENNILFPRYA